MNYNWKIHKRLLDAGGLGPVVYIYPARANGKLLLQRKIEAELLASGRTVIYVKPDKRPVRGVTLAGVFVDRDILTPERYERAERIWNEFWKNKRKGD